MFKMAKIETKITIEIGIFLGESEEENLFASDERDEGCIHEEN